MLSRRELLIPIAAAPLLSGCALERTGAGSEMFFVEEPHLLAAESARGYRSLAKVQEKQAAGWTIAPAIQDIIAADCSRLLLRVRSGGRLLIESGLCFVSKAQGQRQRDILAKGFGLTILTPVQTDGYDSPGYVSYSWPARALVRTFQAVTPVVCDEREVIARFQGMPVCLKMNVGKGCLIYLGAMLGPGLLAEEREARAVGAAIFADKHLCR